MKQLDFEGALNKQQEAKARKLKRQEKAERLGLVKPLRKLTTTSKKKQSSKASAAKLKKPLRKQLIKKLDLASRKLVYLRDNYTCQKCGKYGKANKDYQASHVIPVSAGNKLRWDVNNMKVLCYHDHLNWWHKNPMEAAAWFSDKFPERWTYLQANRGMYKFTLTELEDMLEEYTKRIDKLSNV